MPQKTAVIIGGGIGGLASSILLAKSGWNVSLYEKLPTLGGKARYFTAKGFRFDMGPSWYLMPEVFEHYFDLIGENIHDYIQLVQLTPAYKVFYESHPPLTVNGRPELDSRIFESIEPGAGNSLENYINYAKQTYVLAKESFLYSNYESFNSFLKPAIITKAPKLATLLLRNLDEFVSGFVTDQRLKQILEYQSVFLGGSPYTTPALYHLLSYLDLSQGVFYPKGGMYTVVEALIKIARNSGVKLYADSEVNRITVKAGYATGVVLANKVTVPADLIINNGDIYHSEHSLLPIHYRSYNEPYWLKKVLGPSAMLMYIGVRGQLNMLEHHNLYFADDWRQNYSDIFETKQFTNMPSLYICRSSATDNTSAPKGHENIFVLVPMPAKTLTQTEISRLSRHYLDHFKKIIKRPNLEKDIVFMKIYTANDFAADYHAWQGSALGLNHTLRQSAWMRTPNKSKKVANLFYAGANTQPGIGLPMCLISAELVYKRIIGDQSNKPLQHLSL